MLSDAPVLAPPSALRPIQTQPAEAVFATLETRADGLTAAEVDARLRRYGPNALEQIGHRALLRRFLANFTHLMALLLWAGGLVAFITQTPQLGLAIWLVNLINGIFSFWQEYRAEKATEALSQLLPSYARVVRAGQEQRITAGQLVPGDILLLGEGDHLSADARLVQAINLRVDQSALTGESRPVRKTSEPVAAPDKNISYTDLPNLVFAGTNVLTGAATAVVVATGMQTAFGKIAHLTQHVRAAQSPLQRELNHTTRLVTAIALGAGLFFFALTVVLVGIRPADAFVFALGMIVAYVPEGLLPTVTLTLAMGVQRMARRHALIKRLSAVETLGCTTVICTDKTGTLTENAMTATALYTGGRGYTVTGTGYEPSGQIVEQGRTVDDADLAATARLANRDNPAPAAAAARDAMAVREPVAKVDDLELLLRAAALCCNAHLLPPEHGATQWRAVGDPTEVALLTLARKGGLDLEAERHRVPRIFELPFDAHRKRMSTFHQVGAVRVAYVKGAPQELVPRCARERIGGCERPLTDALRVCITAVTDNYASAGLRVLAVAERHLPDDLRDYTPDTVECDLTFLGLVAMMDPPRPGVTEAVQRCHEAGIRIVMVTGDYSVTAESIARQLGILRETSGSPGATADVNAHAQVLSGAELDALSDAALQAAVRDIVIYARVTPEHKHRIVAALQATGEVVAVTGDGVNDAPALKQADVGVAMGLTGTDVAREAADIVLTDDHFASIINAVEEGRSVYGNVRKFVTYLFTCDFAESVPFILFVFSGGRIPLALTIMEVLSLDLGAEIVPALALGADTPEPGLMQRPPRSLNEHLISPGLVLRAFGFLGLIEGVAALSAFYFQYWTHGFAGQWINLPASGTLYRSATAMTLAAIVTAQLGNLFAQHAGHRPLLHMRLASNRLLWFGVAAALVVACAVIYLPVFQQVFGTAAVPPVNWLFLLAWAPLLLLAERMRQYTGRRFSHLWNTRR